MSEKAEKKDEKKAAPKADKKPRSYRKGTKVPHELIVGKFEGIEKKETGGFVRFGAKGKGKVTVAVSKSQRVGRVLVYGAKVEGAGIKQYETKEARQAAKVGRATGEVDFDGTQEQILAAIDAIVAAMKK